MIPGEILKKLKDHLQGSLLSFDVESGGSINRCFSLNWNQKKYFLKWNSNLTAEDFEIEVSGLETLRKNSAFQIPQPILVEETNEGAFLLLEHFSFQNPSLEAWEKAGKCLAEMHKVTHAKGFGLDHSNFIGSLHQSNNWHSSWEDFFLNERIFPLLLAAFKGGKLTADEFKVSEETFNSIPFPKNQPSSLLHGDLWSGNIAFNSSGPVIFDPAIYFGNREIELAFTELFGGFPASFYNTYEKIFPLEPGYESRKLIWQSYPLLVHLLLFGGGYHGQFLQGVCKIRDLLL